MIGRPGTAPQGHAHGDVYYLKAESYRVRGKPRTEVPEAPTPAPLPPPVPDDAPENPGESPSP